VSVASPRRRESHGLLYHYFSSREEVLETVFRENWRDLLNAFDRIEASDEPPPAQLAGIAKVQLRAWRDRPDLVTVMVREVARSPSCRGRWTRSEPATSSPSG